jgi:N-formylmaleamate deformylase
MNTSLHSHYATANSIRMHFLAGGQGQAVVLLHGLTDWARAWEPTRAWLDARIIAPDLRGHGLSQKPRSGYALTSLAADVAGLMEELGAAPATLIGHSLGAIVALYVAAQHGSVVRALILVDPTLKWRRDEVQDFLQQMAELRALGYGPLRTAYASRHPGWNERDLEQRVQGLLHFSPRCGWGLARENNDHSLEPLLTTVACPTLVIAGDTALGGALSAEQVRRAAQLLPRGEGIMIPGAGHSVHRDQPERFAQAVLGFLARMAGGAR